MPNQLENIIFGLKEENKELKAQNSELQKQVNELKERYVKVLDLNEKVIAKQKAEIERLTEENAHLNKLNEEKRWEEFTFSKKIVAENAELQKQVDELKAENTELYKEHTTLIAGSILKQQDIVKDTAKEIFNFIVNQYDGEYFLHNVEQFINKKYGVEME